MTAPGTKAGASGERLEAEAAGTGSGWWGALVVQVLKFSIKIITEGLKLKLFV